MILTVTLTIQGTLRMVYTRALEIPLYLPPPPRLAQIFPEVELEPLASVRDDLRHQRCLSEA